jgi:U3 small nucleolar RNA-associated protein 14
MSMSTVTKQKNEVVLSKESGAAEKSKNRLRKQARRVEDEREKARQDAEVDIQVGDTLTQGVSANAPASAPTASPPAKTRNRKNALTDEDADANSEVEEQERILATKGKRAKVTAFQQRDLVAKAFAGDNVVQVRHGLGYSG